jgi:hypothetical protein
LEAGGSGAAAGGWEEGLSSGPLAATAGGTDTPEGAAGAVGVDGGAGGGQSFDMGEAVGTVCCAADPGAAPGAAGAGGAAGTAYPSFSVLTALLSSVHSSLVHLVRVYAIAASTVQVTAVSFSHRASEHRKR